MLPDLSSRPLTAREKEVLTLLAHGHRNASIAAQLVISRDTVQHHLTAIYAKLGVRSRYQAILYALHRGLVNPAALARQSP
ncbi:MAG: response regulator transcription factor [Chloroflexota bacterium]